MSQYTQWEAGERQLLASDAQWQSFVEWCDAIHDRLAFFPQLSLLTDEGLSQSPVVLLENLERASSQNPPSEEAAVVIAALTESIKNRGELRSLSVVGE